jgi:hypothetical protein
VDQQPAGRVAEILAQGMDWETVRAIAAHHRVLPLLYRWLCECCPEQVPAQEMAALRSIYQANALRSLKLARRLIRVVEALSAQGVDCLCLKGPTLAVQLYGDIALRQSIDLDILVRKVDLPHAYPALMSAGYTPEIPPGVLSPAQMVRVNKHLGFYDREERLELHSEILESGMAHPVPPGYFCQDPGTVTLLDRPLPVLSAEANLLMLAMQAAGDGWDVLKWPADLARACQVCPPRDWSAFLSSAREMGVARLVHLALLLAVDPGGAALPPEVLAQCRGDARARALAGEVITRLTGQPRPAPVNGLTFYLRARERLRDRLYYVLNQSFIPKQVDWQTFRLPAWLSPAYVILRPLRLLVKFSFGALRGIFQR